MNKVIFIVTILVLMFGVACSGTSEVATLSSPELVAEGGSGETAVSASTNTAQLNENFENALPIQIQLALGTINLEGSELAVEAAQAADMLVLWQALDSLSASGTAAEAEITAVVNQIHGSMTAEQIAAIVDMQLTQGTVLAMVQDGSLNVELSDRSAERSSNGDGGRGGGVLGNNGGRGGNGVTIDPDQAATRQAARANNAGNSPFNQAMIDAVIQLLTTKTG